MSDTRLRVSDGNDKLGGIPNVSLLPIVTCDKSVPCAKSRECYACKFTRRPVVRSAWTANTELARRPAEFMAQLERTFRGINAPRFFRWFVGGDFPSRRFMCAALTFCGAHPGTSFLVFTKRYEWVNEWVEEHGQLPANVSVVFSAWPGHPMGNPHGFPVAWMRDEENLDPRIPADAIECPGGCDQCGMCWSLRKLGRDVVFDKH